MSEAYLEKLNQEQRLAVEHGIGTIEVDDNRALLILAGAGTGKTNTLAHRVVHLILDGADPRRILLMTFSRRAAGSVQYCSTMLRSGSSRREMQCASSIQAPSVTIRNPSGSLSEVLCSSPMRSTRRSWRFKRAQ
jgi:hypothetical protein